MPMPLELSGSQKQAFVAALADAFSIAALRRMLTFQLNKDLEDFEGEDRVDTLFKLVGTAERQGWADRLLEAARAENSGNSSLLAFEQSLAPATPATITQAREWRPPMMAPAPPPDFVARPAEFDPLKTLLLGADGAPVAITAALRGAGGYGKTTLAKALAHDSDVRKAYADGILWVELGEKPDNLLVIISDLVTRLTGTPPGLNTINAAASALGEALGDRRILLVVDDVWRAQDLRPLMQGGARTTRLITTRNDAVLPDDAVRLPVDAMGDDESVSLLAAGLPADQVRAQTRELDALAERLGRWALLLKLVNGFLRRAVQREQPLAAAIIGAGKRLDDKGLVAFDARGEAERTLAVARTIGVSLDLLDGDRRARFGELAVFPEDTHIPIGIVAPQWAASAGLNEFETEDALTELHGLSLLLALDLGRRVLRLHDTIRQFLRDQAGKSALQDQHTRLLGVLERMRRDRDASPAARRYTFQHLAYHLYTFQHLAYHLSEAGERPRLDDLLLDPAWLRDKLGVTGSVATLFADYDRYAVDDAQKLVGRTLRLSAGICGRDERQLLPQLMGRLMASVPVAATCFLERCRRSVSSTAMTAILERRPSLTPPGGEAARLEGHSGPVTALWVLPGGRLASGSEDCTIRLWDLAGGAETAQLEGHSDWVTALCVLSDGRLASGSDDRTIRLWDTAGGAETARLAGHSGSAKAFCVLPDGRLASGSDDRTIRLWDLAGGAESARLNGHSDWVTAFCVLPDGRLASGSYDGTIRLWDVVAGAETARLDGHSGSVTALCVLPDGRLASGSDDRTIRLWDVACGAETARLEGHSGSVRALCVLPDGRLASGSDDRTIRLWDVARSAKTTRLDGHSGSVTALCLLSDGCLASGSGDRTIRLWSTVLRWTIMGYATGRLDGHSDWVRALCVLSDGRLASASYDGTIRLWDVAGRSETARLKGHSSWFRALCSLTDGYLASGSDDGTIRLWDVTRGAETARLAGHCGSVKAL